MVKSSANRQLPFISSPQIHVTMAITKKRAVRKKAAPKKKAAKRSYRRKQEVVRNNEPELFKVEDGIEMPSKAGKVEMQGVYKLIDGLIPVMKVGSSFLIRTSNVTAIRTYLRENHQDKIFKMSPVRPAKTFTRVWRSY
jgi:hypothetical protein